MKLNNATTRWLLAAALVLGAASANAAFSVTQSQESQVTVGMNQSQVRSAIGIPFRVSGYSNGAGVSTWTYYMGMDRTHDITFQVDFNASGNVTEAYEVLNADAGE
jgi:outer membrane protein assembly factor BamE (lipoprotein component of BamABCDE complex)